MSNSISAKGGARPRLRRVLVVLAASAALTAGAGIAFSLSRPTPAPMKARAIGARLDLAAGDVTVTEGGASASLKALSGAPLAIGARVSTGKGARALVRTGDGGEVFLRGETEIVLGEHGIELTSGEVWLDAPRVEGGAIEIALGKHVASASDAGVSVRRAGDEVTVYVARGLSILTSPGGRVEINAGEQGSAKGTDAPKVAAVAFWQDWTGGMADSRPVHGIGSGSGRIYGIDPLAAAGSPAHKLGIAKQVVKAVVRDGVAETEVDQTFSNPSAQAIEGYYWFSVPPQATVTGFALETNGVLVEGEVIERREAAARYAAAVRQAQDPAILEWVDGRSYRARIFPIPASGTRRVVLRYMELLPTVEGKTRYVYPLRSDDGTRFDELSLTCDLGEDGKAMQISTSLDARVEASGARVTMRRSGYVPRADFQLEMASARKTQPVRAWRFAAGQDQADYVMLRYVPEIDFASLPPQKGAVVLVVDTSAGGDEGTRQLRTASAEAILRALSGDDRFAVVALDVAPTVVYPKEGLAAATDDDIAKALERLSEHTVGGATDLGSMFEPALERLHGAEQPAIVYVGDGVATSGETSPDALADRLRRSLSGSRARLFAVGVGADARHDLLGTLTRAGGGQYVRVDAADQTTGEALRLTSAIKTPTMTDLDVNLGAGLDQPFYSATGKLSRGEELVLLARTHHALPPTVTIKGRINGEDKTWEYPTVVDTSVTTGLVPRLWAAEYARRLLGSGATADDNRAKVTDLGLEYGLLTPYTSILALDSEAAYSQQGIGRKSSRVRGVRLTSLDGDGTRERALRAELATGPVVSLGGCNDKRSDADVSTPRASAVPTTTSQSSQGGIVSREEKNLSQAPAEAMDLATAPAKDPAARPATPEPSPRSGDGSGVNNNTPTPPRVAIQTGPGVQRPAGSTPAAAPPRVDRANDKADHKAKEDQGSANARTFAAKTESDRDRYAATITLPRVAKRPIAACSDAASRPLAERIVLWQKRLRRVTTAADLVTQYDLAHAACELPDWRDQAALLDLVQQRIDTEQAAEMFLGYLAGEADAQRFVARAILRRTVDTRLAAAVARVLFGGKVDWTRVDREVLDLDKPEAKVEHLRTAMLVAPGDPAGDLRLMRLLVETGDRPQAIAYGRRLRERGLLTPALAQALGDVLADTSEPDEALRTYSEIVEFDPSSATSRRLLGDIYLRHRWYSAAYRQYKTLTELDPAAGRSPDPSRATNWLRLATAAAGAGRIDEAFRIEHDVAGGEGSPGPDDPRYWARLWSGDRLGALLADPSQAGGKDALDAIARRLKQLQLFSGPATLALLTWEDLDARLSLVPSDEKKNAFAGEATDAGASGLYAVFASPEGWRKTPWVVRWKADAHGRAAKFRVVAITWDGKAFAVSVKTGEVAANAPFATLY